MSITLAPVDRPIFETIDDIRIQPPFDTVKEEV